MSILAVIFPGQGSQKIGMLSEFSRENLLRETFTEASDILKYDLWHLIQYGPVEELNKTYRAQPAILSSSVAIWRIWREKGGKIPKYMAGHSLGEYSALVCAGVIKFSDAVKLVESRGFFMQNIIEPSVGAMSAILGLDENVVISICKKVTSSSKKIVSVSSFNAPNYVVISGYRKSIKCVNSICRKLGANIYILPISVPSHCSLMFPVSKKLRYELEKIKFFIPHVSVINNVDVCIENNEGKIKEALIRQVYTPVRWKEIIEYLIKYNINVLVDIGPGKVLSSMIRHIVNDNSLKSVSISNLYSLNLSIEY